MTPPFKSFLRLLSLTTAASACLAPVFGEGFKPTSVNAKMLYDFRTLDSVEDWIESSDTVRTPGKSKAVFTLQFVVDTVKNIVLPRRLHKLIEEINSGFVQKTREFQRGVFFSLLNPQPNGAGFAGAASRRRWDLKGNTGLELRVRAQGDCDTYKLVLYHKDQAPSTGACAYEVFFTLPLLEWTSVQLPFDDFQPYYRGAPCNNSEPLDVSFISSVGIQVAGGVYREKKQKGASALEIEYLSTYK
ncbi:hypothetical protein HAZT_HAZT007923 [Hyalella azteca]|uniref:NADH:ubiquinone oxidoreductase intermediate-associated protein 30 domain-containing protein n=1 Tax=Hyalella azteca TaxID=294128 RepID=A0A6A0H905_HYAAZ|nr:hypothetical protein HAZT_HAZT007923 [Hyalella azteca]